MTVEVEGWLADLVPRFLRHQMQEVERLEAAWFVNDFASLKFIGHKVRGAAAGYGFAELADGAFELEQAAAAHDRDAARAAIDRIASHLRAVQVVYR